eukprot:747615-Hanusia_phi.AAC.4
MGQPEALTPREGTQSLSTRPSSCPASPHHSSSSTRLSLLRSSSRKIVSPSPAVIGHLSNLSASRS